MENREKGVKKQALVLFAHGSRDHRWAAPFQRLQHMTQEKSPDTVVALAFLECMSPSLPDILRNLVDDGITDVTVAPVFLGQGSHLLHDLPVMLEQLRVAYPEVRINSVAAVGEDEQVLQAIANYCVGVLAR